MLKSPSVPTPLVAVSTTTPFRRRRLRIAKKSSTDPSSANIAVMTHDLPTTFSSFADCLPVDRRLVVGSRRTQRRQTADKPVGRRHFADRQTADCRRSDGGQTTDKTALCRRPDGGLPAVCRRTNKQCNEVFHADRVFYWHTEIACGFILSHSNHRNHVKSMANAPAILCISVISVCQKYPFRVKNVISVCQKIKFLCR